MKPIALLQERLSTKARNILPAVCKEIPIVLITTSRDLPEASFHDVIFIEPSKYELGSAFAISRCCDRLYREGKIAFAIQYSSIGFAILRCPYVHLMNGSFYEDWFHTHKNRKLPERLRSLVGYLHYSLPELISSKRAKKIIAVSESLKDFIVRTYGRNAMDIDVLHNGTSQQFFDLGELKKQQELPPKCIFVGRLHRNKGIVEVLELFTNETSNSCEFLLFGDGPDRGKIEYMAKNDHRIKLMGHLTQEELRHYMATTSIFVFPSHHEGFGLSLLEAMASYHACVCYDIPVNKELLQGAGLLAKSFDAAKIVENIAQCVINTKLRRELGEKARLLAEKYTWERSAQRFIELCREHSLFFSGNT
jgi:glycosyltransferase involved in cell wall biosynthesis